MSGRCRDEEAESVISDVQRYVVRKNLDLNDKVVRPSSPCNHIATATVGRLFGAAHSVRNLIVPTMQRALQVLFIVLAVAVYCRWSVRPVLRATVPSTHRFQVPLHVSALSTVRPDQVWKLQYIHPSWHVRSATCTPRVSPMAASMSPPCRMICLDTVSGAQPMHGQLHACAY
jgi:hypothetical protein